MLFSWSQHLHSFQNLSMLGLWCQRRGKTICKPKPSEKGMNIDDICTTYSQIGRTLGQRLKKHQQTARNRTHILSFPCVQFSELLLHQVTTQNLILLLLTASYAPYNSWKEHRRTSTHMEKLEHSLVFRKHPSLCLNGASLVATRRFTRIDVPFPFNGHCHVTFLWFSYKTSYYVDAWLGEMTWKTPLRRAMMFRCKKEQFYAKLV